MNRVMLNPRKNATGFRGVIYDRTGCRPYKAKIRRAGKYVYVGSYATAEEAARAFDQAAIKEWGPERAGKLNYPEEQCSER